jgi:hypothetical protein
VQGRWPDRSSRRSDRGRSWARREGCSLATAVLSYRPDSGFVQHASSPRVPGFDFLTAAKMRHEPSLVAQDRIGEPTVRAPLHGVFRRRPTVPLLPAVAMIVRGGHRGDVQERTPLQRLVDTMLDRAEATSPTVKYDIWMPSLESLLLPRDPPESPRAALPVVHRYRSHTVQPFDTAALTVWVSPAGGVTAPPGASSYSGDPITERITDH